MASEDPHEAHISDSRILKSDINTLSTALSTALSQVPQNDFQPRWLSLSTFHNRSRSWDWHKDLENSIISNVPAINTSSMAPSGSVGLNILTTTNSFARVGNESVSRLHRPRSGTNNSINMDGSLLEESQEIEPAEKARQRIVAVLRSYFWNLSEGMLVSGDKVDGDVAEALKELIKGKNVDKRGERQGVDLGMSKESMSDEEAVVSEIEEYRRNLMKMGKSSEVSQTVVELAKKVLAWGLVKGFTNDNRSEVR